MSTSPLSILVVDDDQDNAASLGELFEMEGHRVQVAHSGDEAIRAYVTQSFDIAFMDVMMPGRNGVDSFLEIRRMKPNACVYMMTGYSVEELLQQAVAGGALGVLEKPFDAAEVLRLTDFVGPNGMLLATGQARYSNVGEAIYGTLRDSGRSCRLLSQPGDLLKPVAHDDVLIVDTQMPLIDGVSIYSDLQKSGHAAPTILVASAQQDAAASTGVLRDIAVTGILNKPFDPLELLTRLSTLAA